jgi:hypothetical protein
MSPADLPITAMFEELVVQGFIKPTTHMEDLVFPGALTPVPSVIGYATPDIPSNWPTTKKTNVKIP